MARIIETTAYDLDELSAAAKDNARSWFRQTIELEWWDGVYEDFAEICSILGIDLCPQTVRLMNGATRDRPTIYFSGFSSQGDGACFEGRLIYAKGASALIRVQAPKDIELHRIADQLARVQARNFYQLSAIIRHRGRYYHEYCMGIEVRRDGPFYQRMTSGAEDAVIELLRALARWLYRQLEAEYVHKTSDEAVDEGITANDYTFTADGKRFG